MRNKEEVEHVIGLLQLAYNGSPKGEDADEKVESAKRALLLVTDALIWATGADSDFSKTVANFKIAEGLFISKVEARLEELKDTMQFKNKTVN